MQKSVFIYAYLIFFLCFGLSDINGQTNIKVIPELGSQILQGNYTGTDYAAASATPVMPSELGTQLDAEINADSLKKWIIALSQFGTRNSASDTISTLTGIGAARRWVFQKFEDFSAANGNRLIPAYLQFDQSICGFNQHRNVMAILPGSNPMAPLVIIEGHIDSRCAVLCDTVCLAEGVEDNATGTALVIELARVMSKYQYQATIVFMATTAEEQGLLGANAFATWAQNKNIPIQAVLNNDVIGGIYCGETSSAPSCPGIDNIDSTSVRLFSAGSFNSKNKQLSRYIKLQYHENLLPTATVPMNIRIMAPEDRTGRGGDHIPFREKGFAAMRFTAANEHGDASNGPGYDDRQHTSEDVLGADTNGDGEVDSFYVDFNYLKRNASINANAASMIAQSVVGQPDYTATRFNGTLTITLNSLIDTYTVRVALRTTTNDWDTVYTFLGNSAQLQCPLTGALFVSIAGVNDWGVESLFSVEKLVQISGTDEVMPDEKPVYLIQNKPNPFDESTWISFWVNTLKTPVHKSEILIHDLGGRLVQRLPVQLNYGLNEVLYTHGYGVRGTFNYSLLINDQIIDTKQMIYAN